MNNGPLDHTLETGGWLDFQILRRVDDRGQLIFDMADQHIS